MVGFTTKTMCNFDCIHLVKYNKPLYCFGIPICFSIPECGFKNPNRNIYSGQVLELHFIFRCFTYAKLFLGMGIMWIFEIIAGLAENSTNNSAW